MTRTIHLKAAKRLLEEVTALYPPGGAGKMRHNLTINDDGELELTLMFNGCFQSLKIVTEEIDCSLDLLIDDIGRALLYERQREDE